MHNGATGTCDDSSKCALSAQLQVSQQARWMSATIVYRVCLNSKLQTSYSLKLLHRED